MHKALLTALGALLLGAGAAAAGPEGDTQAPPAEQVVHAGPSFPCPTPRDPLGELICDSPVLSRVDLSFVQAYQALRQQLPPEEQRTLRAESVDFGLAVRTNCGIGPAVAPSAPPPPPPPVSSLSCVQEAYNHQRQLWTARLSGPAAQEAARSLEQQIHLQRDLQQIGLLPVNDAIDGVYGTDTRNAIVAFQQTMGLPVTGLLGDSDADVLEQQAVLRAPRPQPALAPAPIPATPVRTPWEDFQSSAMGVGLQASVTAGGPCAVSLDVRNPEALANATRDYDQQSANGVPDQDDRDLFKAELLFLLTQVSAQGVHAFYASQPPGTDRCVFRVATYTTDVYGRDVPEPLFSFLFDRDTYSKVVWNRFDPVNMPKIVASFSYGAYAQERLREMNGTNAGAQRALPVPQDSPQQPGAVVNAGRAEPFRPPASLPNPPAAQSQTVPVVMQPAPPPPRASTAYPPDDEQTFIAVIDAASQRYDAAANEMAQGMTRAQRAHQICAAVVGTQVSHWIGTVDSLSSTSDGQGVLTVRIGPHITLATTNNRFSEDMSTMKTLIAPDSRVMQIASTLKPKQSVVFSGSFAPSDSDCFEETSLTQSGSMHDPEFLFQFSAVEAAN